MKFVKDKDNSWSLVTKESEIYFNFYVWWWDLALPVHIDIDRFSKEYTEIRLHILFFSLSFTRITHKYSAELDKMFDGD